MLPGSQTAFELDDVRAGLSYTVRVSARVGAREGGASILTVRRGEYCRRAVGEQLPAGLTAVLILTSDLYLSPPELETPLAIPGLRVVASDATRVRVAWGPVPGASGFRISWRTDSGRCGVCGRVMERNGQGMGDGGGRQEPCQHFPLTLGPESSQTLPPESTSTDITGLRPGTSYQVALSALRGREEGPPAVIVVQTGQGLTQPLGYLSPVLLWTPMPSPLRPLLRPRSVTVLSLIHI